MPISFKCPHCKKSLKVKDALAGKKGTCPSCKKPLMIPMPVDYEALAAAALADEPPATKVEEQAQQPTQVARTIDFTCPFCDAELHLNPELGGKKEPCPECKRIIKVPMLVQERAKDWRTVQQKTGPSAAVKTTEPQLEGVWSTTQQARVSSEALEEAEATIEEDEEPVGVLGWTKRIAIVGGTLGIIVLAVLFISRRQNENAQERAFRRALEIAENKGSEKAELSPARRAEIFRAAAEFKIDKDKPAEALTNFKKARGQFPRQGGASPLDQDCMLLRLAIGLVDLGGDPKEVEDERRLDWNVVSKELATTLRGISSAEVKALAVRDVSAKLLKRDQGRLAFNLVRTLAADDSGQIKAQWVGLVYEPATPLQEKERAEMLDLVKKQVPPPDPAKKLDRLPRLAYAEARAREGKYQEAMQLVEARGPLEDCTEAALIVADVAQDKGSSEGKRFLDKAFPYADQLKSSLSPWLRLETVRAAVRSGDLSRAKELSKGLPADPKADYKSWAALEIFRAELANAPGEADVNLVLNSGTEKDSLPRALAWEMLARHNIRVSSHIRTYADTVEDPSARPFMLVGIALGTASTE